MKLLVTQLQTDGKSDSYVESLKKTYFVMNEPKKSNSNRDSLFVFQFEPPHRQHFEFKY